MDIALIDALAAGCIPIVAVNHVVLPFFEVIDWKRFILFVMNYCLLETSHFNFYVKGL